MYLNICITNLTIKIMALTNIQAAVNKNIIDSIDAGITMGKWKTSYEFVKKAVTEKLIREGLIKT